MENIQPWCVSRQLWWGHRIPAWYGTPTSKATSRRQRPAVQIGGRDFVAETEEEAIAQARDYYGATTWSWSKTSARRSRWSTHPQQAATPIRFAIWRDEDVLDTWFSSALWPFSTLGWPDETPDLTRYYPTDVLVTGFDIIFFWVARMMMMGLQFMDEVPFNTVYIHALVRDAHGAKMSKSKGNVVDPLGLIDEYGADALRFTLAAMEARAATSSCRRSASRATAISRPSCGTPAASPR